MNRDSLLFVYGTLRPFTGIPMACWLSSVGRHLGVARTPGRLYDLGRYPGLVRSRRRTEWVVGDLYALSSPRSVFEVLDRYEAGPHRRGYPRFARVRCVIRRPDGRRRRAWVYFYRNSILAARRVSSGDYDRYATGTPSVSPAAVIDATSGDDARVGEERLYRYR